MTPLFSQSYQYDIPSQQITQRVSDTTSGSELGPVDLL